AAGAASVPAGASTGAHEAHELRDGDRTRYGGLGCRRAVEAIEGEIADALARRPLAGPDQLDPAPIGLGGPPEKARLGANSILAVSLAFARAAAADGGLPLYEHLARLVGEAPRALPRPEINLFSGGRHAGGQVALQDVLIVPSAARTVDEALA